ncbi:class I SAM-dependent methyltransferase [Actinospongicola halichondriae]|uniref:class I SAM-dependent methyltransferase n=1 Tax=Actinospongicola halichondriae TaxID=3236844 RepID=UPI003D4C7A3B
MATAPALPDQAAKLLGPLGGTATVWGLELAVRLGIVDELAAHPDGLTAAEVAAALTLDPEYTHVILRSAFAGEIVELTDDRYRLADHMATLLLDQDHPAFLGGALKVFVAMRETFLDLREFAKTGQREWWGDFDPEWIDAVGAHCQAYYRRLVDVVVPQLPDVEARLTSGARFLDLACGTCRGPAKVVGAFPNTMVTAVDADRYTLEVAEREMKERELGGRFRFVHAFLEELDIDGGHDLAHINVSLHEARDMERAVERVHAALDPGGTFLVSEFPFPDDEHDCRTVPGRIMCGVQFFESHIGCQLRPASHFVGVLERAGFRDVGVIDVNPMHVVIHGTK